MKNQKIPLINILVGYNNTGKTLFANAFCEKHKYIKFYNQPELGKHPVLHGEIAQKIFEEAKNTQTPCIVETHAEIIVLRARNLVAHGILNANDVVVTMCYSDDRMVESDSTDVFYMDKQGTLNTWYGDMFNENLEELYAMDRGIYQWCENSKKRIEIEKDGTLTEWEQGFFNENVAEIISMRKAVMKNKAIKQQD